MYNIYDINSKELREVQLKSLELFLYFKQICDTNHLTMYFCGGCCIGTIRHKGFIPWDDDIDVFMPRDDYEKLYDIWTKNADLERYPIQKPGEDNDYGRLIFTVINDSETTFIKEERADLDINHGIALDILPLDGCPSSKIKRNIQIFWSLIYSLYCANMIPTNHGKLISLVGKVALFFIPGDNLKRKIWKFAEKKMTKYSIDNCEYVTELCSGPKYMKNKYPKNAFEYPIYKEFEGYNMPIPVGYHDYLTIAFGDYMKLPPKEQQVAHHYVTYCDMFHSYKKYKGIYYSCKEKVSK